MTPLDSVPAGKLHGHFEHPILSGPTLSYCNCSDPKPLDLLRRTT